MTEQQLIAFFQDLHRHPELGYEETRTTQKVRQALEQAGIDLLPSGLRTGLIAVIRGKKPGKTIGLRADMDALPVQEETGLPYASEEKGKMHACGHDFHTTCMLGAALLLKERENELAGTVKIVFQPGEELSDGGGGKFLAASPALADVQEYYAGHTYPGFPAGTLGIKEGPVMAAPDTFTVRILGKGAHAGNPHLGIDPIPAAAALTLSLQTLITRSKDAFEPAVLSVTHLQAGTTVGAVTQVVETHVALATHGHAEGTVTEHFDAYAPAARATDVIGLDGPVDFLHLAQIQFSRQNDDIGVTGIEPQRLYV